MRNVDRTILAVGFGTVTREHIAQALGIAPGEASAILPRVREASKTVSPTQELIEVVGTTLSTRGITTHLFRLKPRGVDRFYGLVQSLKEVS